VPRLVRHFFARRREWLGDLCRIAERLLSRAYAAALPAGRPALIVFVQTFGDRVNFNPHLHVLAADGVFLPGGCFVALPRVPGNLLAEGFRRAVLDFLVENEAVSEELRARILAWRHGGFSAHNEVCVGAEDAEGFKRLAGSIGHRSHTGMTAPGRSEPLAGRAYFSGMLSKRILGETRCTVACTLRMPTSIFCL